MKLKKVLISLITIFTLFFADNVKALSTAPDSFLVDSSKIYLIKAEKYLNGKVNLYYKENAEGTSIYCTEIRDLSVSWGKMDYTLSKELDARYAYIMENGYPNKSITGNKEKDYFITALAVWYISQPNDSVFDNFDFNKGTHYGKENDTTKYVANLINGANNYSYVNPSIKINGSTNEFNLSSDKKYYVSNGLGVTTTGTVGNYTVSLENAPSGTVITDINGNTKNTFSVNEKFIVKVPVSSISNLSNEFKINVTASGSVKQAYLYEPAKSNFQNVAVLYQKNSNLSDNATLKLNLTTKVQISKVDATTSKELPGATLTIKNSKGEVVKTWVSSNEPEIIENLPIGKYTLTEEIAPEGYVLSKETVTFEIKLDGTVTKVEMKNELTVTEISKVDATTSKELPGATLTIKDSRGEVVKTWISSNKPEIIKGLAVGKYTLTEEIAPEGYVLSTETVEFEVKSDGTVTKVVMNNKPEEKTPIYISKQDATTSEELAGAHLELRDEKGNLVEAWVSGDTPHMIEKLEPGKYFLTEVLAPEGYELSTETVEFTVKEDGTVDGDIIMYNEVETVEVPSTSSFKNITTSLIGIIVIGLGSMIIYNNYKKNEEY